MGVELVIGLVFAIASAVAAVWVGQDTNNTNTRLTRETNQSNQDIQRETNELQMQLAGQANDWSIEQWNRENAYNDPSAQMARLKRAGINPALAYSNGIMNEAAGSPAANMANVDAMRNVAPQIQKPDVPDPLTAANIDKLNAEAEAIRDQNRREEEKQPITLEQLSADLAQTNAKTDEILQFIKNLKMDEQIKAQEYLSKSLDYQFASTTFNDAVDQFKTTLSNLKKVGRQADFDYNRGLQILTYEVAGFDLSNKRQRALLNIDLQTYRQTEELFDSLKTKYFWDSMNSWARYNNTEADTSIKGREKSLKELEFWINVRENPKAARGYFNNHKEEAIDPHFFVTPIGYWMQEFSDFWNHGLNLPIRIGFGK